MVEDDNVILKKAIHLISTEIDVIQTGTTRPKLAPTCTNAQMHKCTLEVFDQTSSIAKYAKQIKP